MQYQNIHDVYVVEKIWNGEKKENRPFLNHRSTWYETSKQLLTIHFGESKGGKEFDLWLSVTSETYQCVWLISE